MLANAQMTEEQLGKETVEEFLHRASMMLRRQEVRKGMYLAGGERHRTAPTKQATWRHGTDPMELDMMQTTDRKKESWTYPLQLPLRRGRQYSRKPRIGKRTRPGNGGSPGQGRLITLPAIWKDPWGRQAVEEALIDTGAKTTFIDETWA